MFSFEKTAVESYRLLREAHGEHVPSQDMCERWFRSFKNGDFEVADKEYGKLPKNSKLWNCKHCRIKMIRKYKNNSPSNLALVDELFTVGYERWERFRRTIDDYHVSLTTGRWKSAKTHVTFYSLGTKGSRLYIV